MHNIQLIGRRNTETAIEEKGVLKCRFLPPSFGGGWWWFVCGKPGVFDTFSWWKHNHKTQHFEYNVQIYTEWFKFCNILVRIKFHKHHFICSKYYEDNIWANFILALMWIFMVERERDLGNQNNHLHKQCDPKSKAFRKLFEPKLHIKYRSTMRQMVDLPKGLNSCLISSKKLSNGKGALKCLTDLL